MPFMNATLAWTIGIRPEVVLVDTSADYSIREHSISYFSQTWFAWRIPSPCNHRGCNSMGRAYVIIGCALVHASDIAFNPSTAVQSLITAYQRRAPAVFYVTRPFSLGWVTQSTSVYKMNFLSRIYIYIYIYIIIIYIYIYIIPDKYMNLSCSII